MNAKKVLVILGCVALLGTTPLTSISHEDPSVSARDAARNHLVNEVGPAVYNVTTNFRLHKRDEAKTIQEMGGTGTAFGVTEDGLILTAFHLVQAPEFTAQTPLGTVKLLPSYTPPASWSYPDGEVAEGSYMLTAKDGTIYTGEIVAIDPKNDLAILSIAKSMPGKKFPFIEIERGALRYDSVVAIGSPFGFSFSVTEGIISDPSRRMADEQERTLVQTDTTLHPGNSGGPLLLLRNHRVAGVVVENYTPAPFGIGIAFAVPASVAAKFLDDTLLMLKEGRTQEPVPR
ncbi:MAG: trypsin-like peptidase domain-containing protein [bacterium]|nr:trypsin-like peptidase domain-containing protein [bacterium]